MSDTDKAMTSFRFRCYLALRKRLGELDAVCEWLELGARELIEQTTSEGVDRARILKLSDHHKVRVHHVHTALLRRHAPLLYIASAYASLKLFLSDLRREHPTGETWRKRKDGESALNAVRSSLNLQSTLEIEVCEHYHTIRSTFSHPDTGRSTADCKALRARVAGVSTLQRLVAPNQWDDVSFDDFVLFTRCIKVVAEQLCLAGRPSAEEIRMLASEAPELAAKTKRFSNRPDRLQKAQMKVLQTYYSLSAKDCATLYGLS